MRLALLLTLCACRATPPAPAAAERLDVAVTFDDLPRHGPEVPGVSRLQIHHQILAALRKHGVPQVYGFINGKNLEGHPEDRTALEAWVAAGHPLGNHTYSHLAPDDVPAYLADIDRNEPLLRELMPGAEQRWKVFRYPFLKQGQTLEARNAIRAHLAGRGYRIAETTIDFGDFAWNDPYARCLARGDGAAIEELKASFLEAASVFLAFDDSLAQRLFHRRISHLLILHVGAFDALMIDALLDLYQRSGVRFVPFEAALADEVYREDPPVAPTSGDILQEEVVTARGVKLIPWPQEPLKGLEAMCR